MIILVPIIYIGALNDQTNKVIEIKKFLENNSKTVLLDVRTKDELTIVGKIKAKDLGIKSFFITTFTRFNRFLDNVKKYK